MTKHWEDLLLEHDDMRERLAAVEHKACWLKRGAYTFGVIIFLLVTGSLGTIAGVGVPALTGLAADMGVVKGRSEAAEQWRNDHEDDHEKVLDAVDEVDDKLVKHMLVTNGNGRED